MLRYAEYVDIRNVPTVINMYVSLETYILILARALKRKHDAKTNLEYEEHVFRLIAHVTWGANRWHDNFVSQRLIDEMQKLIERK
jgi:hypothetical protein